LVLVASIAYIILSKGRGEETKKRAKGQEEGMERRIASLTELMLQLVGERDWDWV